MLITLSMLLPKLGLDVLKSWTSVASALNLQLGWGAKWKVEAGRKPDRNCLDLAAPRWALYSKTPTLSRTVVHFAFGIQLPLSPDADRE